MADGEVILRKATGQDQNDLWKLINNNHEWEKYDGPYFEKEEMTYSSFCSETFNHLLQDENTMLIEGDGKILGKVSSYWECEATRWLEAGIIIYPKTGWGKGAGCKALRLWTTHLFDNNEIERVGITNSRKSGVVLFSENGFCRRIHPA